MPNPVRIALSQVRAWLRTTPLLDRDVARIAGLSRRSITNLKTADGHDPKASTLARVFDVMAAEGPSHEHADAQSVAQVPQSLKCADDTVACGAQSA